MNSRGIKAVLTGNQSTVFYEFFLMKYLTVTSFLVIFATSKAGF
ncbi:hypothetical protein HMPREF9135_2438 [Segatella baroniae F0067]|uniref:Uncharacterized protein n=1 Tax=Segatella baroniae F0067 TaxID=1115809 RepID=U2P720_9BACT|nr:hypothetical protein HMPREF9135_2438 [Segatella baroniae F0067]